ncbi:hypothetical protein Hanom_Chr11g00973131 [Helianthus anomalus]
MTPAATNPLMCAISANIIAFCLSQTCNKNVICEFVGKRNHIKLNHAHIIINNLTSGLPPALCNRNVR